MAIKTANPYLQARLFSQIGRIQAAQELALAESTLKNYELGLSPVPDSTVLRMSYLYRTPWLRGQHLQKNVVFCDIFGLIPESPTLAFGVLQMQKEVSDVVGVLPAIISDVVNQSRVSSHLISELREAAVALLSIFGRETKKETACAGTQTVSRIYCDVCSATIEPVTELKVWNAEEKKIYHFCSFECLKKMQKKSKKRRR